VRRRLPLPALAAVAAVLFVARGPADEIPLLDRPGGHAVPVDLGGTTAEFLVDTAATVTVIPEGLAARIGQPPGPASPTRSVQGLTGTVRLRVVTLPSLRIGDRHLADVEAVVLPHAGGALLGLNVLRPLGAQVDLGDGTLRLPGRGLPGAARETFVAAARLTSDRR